MTGDPATGPVVASRAGPMRHPLRVGVVGLGNVGLGFHLPALLALPELARVVAVADPSPERRALAAGLTGLPADAVHASPADLLGRDGLDVVDLATPPHVRMPLALRAIEAGHAVLCEKPITIVPAEAASIVAAASERRVPVGVVHNYLAFPEIRVALAAIREGRIGDVEVVILNYLGVEDRPGNAAWQPNWRHDPALAGGGVLMDMLHVVYVAEAFLGRPVERVSAQVLARAYPAPVEEIALCRLEADGAVALVNVGWGVGPGGIVVSGREGRIEIRYAGGGTSPFAPLDSVRLARSDGTTDDLTPARPPRDGILDVHLVESFRRFFEDVADGRPPAVSAADGLRVLETTLAAYESAAIGRSVGLPLEATDPVHRRGTAGLAELDLAAGGPIASGGMFGIGQGRGG